MMTPVINALTPSTEWVDTIAMLGFSFAGILAARGRGVDPVGVFILAFTSAFGGVTVRDMLLDIRPFYWVSHEAFTWLIICFTIFAPVIAARLSDRIARELFLWADAVGHRPGAVICVCLERGSCVGERHSTALVHIGWRDHRHCGRHLPRRPA
mgnify:CR=1 FL=1